jgi:hypothetical protein
LLARLAPSPYAVSSLRLLRRRGSHEAGDVRESAVAAARAAGLDGRRARVEADDARRSPVGRHFRSRRVLLCKSGLPHEVTPNFHLIKLFVNFHNFQPIFKYLNGLERTILAAMVG